MRRSFSPALVAGGLIPLAFPFVVGRSGVDADVWLWDAAGLAALLAAIAATLRAHSGVGRVVWSMRAAAAGAFLVGALLRTVSHGGLSFSAADLLWLLPAPLAVAAIAFRSPGALWWRLSVLDAVPVALFGSALVLVTNPSLRGFGKELFLAAYAGLYALLFLTAFQLAAVKRFRVSPTWYLLTGAFLLLAAAAGWWPGEIIGEGAARAHPAALLWTGGFLLLALAGGRAAFDPDSLTSFTELEREHGIRAVPPMAALAGIVVVLAAVHEQERPLLYVLLLAAVVAVAARFYLVRSVNRHLLEKVERSHGELDASERRYRSIFESAAVGCALTSLEGRIVEANEAFAQMVGRRQEELTELVCADLIHPEDAGRALTLFAELGAGARDSYQVEQRYLHRNGGTVTGRVSVSLVRDERGEPLFALSLVEDVTEHRRTEMKFQGLLESAPDAIVIVDEQGLIVLVNAQTEGLFGYARDELIGSPVEILVLESVRARHAGYRQAYDADPCPRPMGANRDLLGLHKDGSEFPVEISLSPISVDGGRLVAAAIRDVSERKRLEEELRRQAFHDSLTGLANRALLAERVEHAIARSRRQGSTIALLLIDLDDFKGVNDTLGHAAGDQLLVEAARRLRDVLRATDTIARLGGDEFAVLLEDVLDLEAATATADRIGRALAGSCLVQGERVSVGSSIGLAVGHAGEVEAGELLRNADIAMYSAKRSAGNAQYAVFDPRMLENVRSRRDLTAELERAIERREIVAHYQPIVDLLTGLTVGVEALARWQHPERGLLMPEEFIRIAEETGLIVPLGRLVIEQACTQARLWQGAGYEPLGVSVNVSGVSLGHGLVGDVEAALATSGLAPERLTIELTESSAIKNASELHDLRALGVRLAVDDFGAGYSSLHNLRALPVDELKVDRCFVEDIEEGEHERSLVETILRLARTLGLETVGEGIETVEQRQWLRRLGCGLGQGFLFAKPLTPSALERYLVDEQRRLAPPADAFVA